MSSGPVILYLVETPGQLVEFRRFIVMIAKARQARHVVLIYDFAVPPDVIEDLRKAGAECIEFAATAMRRVAGSAVSAPLGLGRVLRFLRELLQLPLLARKFGRMLRERNVKLVVVSDDDVASRSRALVAAASRRDIPVMLLPYTMLNPDEPAAAAYGRRSHEVRRWHQRMLLSRRPAWSRRYRDRTLLRLPAGKSLALELAGLAPAQPWLSYGGTAVVAVESEAMLRHYRTLGLSDRQLTMTGSLADVALAQSRRERDERRTGLRSRLNLSAHPILLCSLPPDQFSIGRASECQFSDFSALVEGWASLLAGVADRFAIVVRPHPRIAKEALEPFRRKGIAVTLEDTAGLVPLCDLYLASISATIRWAIACGRPVVNYDVYGYRYLDYADAPGVLNVDRLDRARELLNDLGWNRDRLAKLAEAQGSVAAQWGCLDGQSDRRLLALFDRMLGTNLASASHSIHGHG